MRKVKEERTNNMMLTTSVCYSGMMMRMMLMTADPSQTLTMCRHSSEIFAYSSTPHNSPVRQHSCCPPSPVLGGKRSSGEVK